MVVRYASQVARVFVKPGESNRTSQQPRVAPFRVVFVEVAG
jgi:hypothetical protein